MNGFPGKHFRTLVVCRLPKFNFVSLRIHPNFQIDVHRSRNDLDPFFVFWSLDLKKGPPMPVTVFLIQCILLCSDQNVVVCGTFASTSSLSILTIVSIHRLHPCLGNCFLAPGKMSDYRNTNEKNLVFP